MFTQADREIFEYYNGERNVFGDPLRIWRTLNNLLEGDPNKVLQEAKSPIVDIAHPAQEKVLGAVDAAFEMVPFDSVTGYGAMESDRLAALDSFLVWVQKKSPRQETLATSSLPTTSFPSPSPTTITQDLAS